MNNNLITGIYPGTFDPITYGHIDVIKKGINFSDDSIEMLSTTVRGNARNAVMRSKEIVLYCESENQNTFEEKDYLQLTDLLGILPFGIT